MPGFDELLPLPETPAWRALSLHAEETKWQHLRQLFADDPTRAERFTLDSEGIVFDYSKQRVTSETMKLLLELADERMIRQKIDAMFTGEHINVTEDRAVLHVALRAPLDEELDCDGKDVVPEVHRVLDRMAKFADRIRN